LYGSEGNVKVFSSEYGPEDFEDRCPRETTNPKAKVQVVDPIVLDAKLCRPCDCCCPSGAAGVVIPRCVRCCFNGEFGYPSQEKAVRITLGLFTIVQLERDVQMLIPAYDFCVPTKECGLATEDPCDAFNRIKFPVNEFFPPNDKSESACAGTE
jgi:hypothetical protein